MSARRPLVTLRAWKAARSPGRDRDRASIVPIPSRRARTALERARDRLASGDPQAIADAEATDREEHRG